MSASGWASLLRESWLRTGDSSVGPRSTDPAGHQGARLGGQAFSGEIPVTWSEPEEDHTEDTHWRPSLGLISGALDVC